MRLSPFSHYFIPPRSKYYPQHPVLKHPRSVPFCQRIRPGPRLFRTLRNKLGVLRWGVVSPRPTPKLADHPLSALRNCLFNIFAATLHICRPSPPSATWGRAMPWWQGTHLTRRKFCTKENYRLFAEELSFVNKSHVSVKCDCVTFPTLP
jgi:hypothetical protein